MADFDQVGKDQATHGIGFELQVGPGFLHLILLEQQVDDLLGVVHGVTPAAQGGAAEGFDAIGVVAQLCLAGEQDVAIEIDTVGVG